MIEGTRARRLLFSIFCAVLTLSACKGDSGLSIGERVPNFVLPALDGKIQKLSNHRGNVVLVNLWATYRVPFLPSLGLEGRLDAHGSLTEVAVAIDSSVSTLLGNVHILKTQFLQKLLAERLERLGRKSLKLLDETPLHLAEILENQVSQGGLLCRRTELAHGRDDSQSRFPHVGQFPYTAN